VTVSEVLMGNGTWTLRFKPDTPRRVLAQLDWVFTPTAALGHVLIYPTVVDAARMSATDLLATARYVGVLLEWRDDLTVGGDGPAWWLGDANSTGPILATTVSRTNGTLAQWIGDICPSSLTVGTVTSPGGSATGGYQWVTRRTALEAICDAFGVEWQITPRMRLNVGVSTVLWPAAPTTVVMPRWEGRDGTFRSLDAAGLERSQDLRDWANAAHVLGPTGAVTSSAASGLYDINGNAVTRGVIVQGSAATPGTEATVAAAERALRQAPRRHVKLDAKNYDLAGDISVGGYVWAYDPDRGLFDTANQVLVAGQTIAPLKMRAMAHTWPIRPGMGVWFRGGDGALTDLTDYVEFDKGTASVELDAVARTQANPAGLVGTTDSGGVADQVSYGPWMTYDPAATFGGSSANVTSAGRWRRDGTHVLWEAEWATSGAVAAGQLGFQLPVPVASVGPNAGQIVGAAMMVDSGTGRRGGDVFVNTDTGGYKLAHVDVARTGYLNPVAQTVPWTWAAGDAGFASGRYRCPN